VIAQVDEQQMAVVALSVDPSRQADRFADIAETQVSTAMGTIGVHDQFARWAENCGEKGAPRFDAGKLFVNPAARR
jgi:hypothetical protein